jgi:dienelactone hydrolase
MSREVEYSDGDTKLRGLMAVPAGQARAAVLVFHEGPGLGTHVKRRIEMLAELGYAAFAADFFGNGSPTLAEIDEIRARMTPWLQDRAALRRRALAALETFARQSVAPQRTTLAIGYCFGGTVALELARAGAPLLGVVSFHGGLKTTLPAAPGSVKGRVLSCVGANDPTIPLEDRTDFEREMETAGAKWQTALYSGAEHSFTNRDMVARPGFSYNPWADHESWAAMQTFFDAVLEG